MERRWRIILSELACAVIAGFVGMAVFGDADVNLRFFRGAFLIAPFGFLVGFKWQMSDPDRALETMDDARVAFFGIGAVIVFIVGCFLCLLA